MAHVERVPLWKSGVEIGDGDDGVALAEQPVERPKMKKMAGADRNRSFHSES